MSSKTLCWFLVMLLGVGIALGAPAKSKKKRPVAPPAVLGPATLLELGKGVARLGLVLDPSTGELTARLLEAGSEERVRVVQDGIRINGLVDGKKFTAKLLPVADKETGEKKWDASVFRVKVPELMGADRFEGTIFFLRVKEFNVRNLRFIYQEGGKEEVKEP